MIRRVGDKTSTSCAYQNFLLVKLHTFGLELLPRLVYQGWSINSGLTVVYQGYVFNLQL